MCILCFYRVWKKQDVCSVNNTVSSQVTWLICWDSEVCNQWTWGAIRFKKMGKHDRELLAGWHFLCYKYPDNGLNCTCLSLFPWLAHHRSIKQCQHDRFRRKFPQRKYESTEIQTLSSSETALLKHTYTVPDASSAILLLLFSIASFFPLSTFLKYQSWLKAILWTIAVLH